MTVLSVIHAQVFAYKEVYSTSPVLEIVTDGSLLLVMKSFTNKPYNLNTDVPK